MISIVVCSRNKTIDAGLAENIRTTIACAYELIVIDNSENKYSIFEAYNIGIASSLGAYLCFIHDDIFIHTTGWGTIINNILDNNSDIGLIGVAGAKMKTKMPSAWWDCPKDRQAINIIQHFKDKEKEHWQFGFDNRASAEVVAIDGVFIAMRKVDGIQFNTSLSGFHNYDLNISFEYKRNGFRIIVTNEILIEHFSIGVIDESWYKSTLKLLRIYGGILPLMTDDPKNTAIINYLEFKNGFEFTNQIFDLGYKRTALQLWAHLIIMKPYSKYHIRFLKRLLHLC